MSDALRIGDRIDLDYPASETRRPYPTALFDLIPGLPQFHVLFLSQVLNGLLLPFILVTIALALMSVGRVWATVLPIG